MTNMTPEELAKALDRALPSGSQARLASSGSAADPLVQAALEVANAPRPVLTDAAKSRMAAKMFAALDALPAAPTAEAPPTQTITETTTPPSLTASALPRRPINFLLTGIAASAAAVLLVVVGMLAVLDNRDAAPTPTSPSVALLNTDEPTETPTTEATDQPTEESTEIPTTEPTEAITDEPTEAPTVQPTTEPTQAPLVQPTDEPTVIPTVQPTEEPTSAPTDAPTERPTAAPNRVTEEPNLSTPRETTFIIEGQVEEVLETGVVIAGFEVKLSDRHPLLRVLRAGDWVRVEGQFVDNDDTPGNGGMPSFVLDLTETDITLDNPTEADNAVEVGPDGEVWRDDGTCRNPPPPWATGGGWQNRCGTAGGGNTDGNPGQGQGQGNDNGNNSNTPGQGQGNNNAGGLGQGGENNSGGGQGQGNNNGGGQGNGNGGGGGQGQPRP